MESVMKNVTAACSGGFWPDERRSEAGYAIMEHMGGYTFYMIMIAAAALLLVVMFRDSKLTQTEQTLASLRMKTIAVFSASVDGYVGLDNDIAIRAGIIPQTMQRGNAVRNAWGGEVEIAEADGDSSSFTITLHDVPEKDCISLAVFQREAWDAVSVNGNDVNMDDGVGVAGGYCESGNRNVLMYTAR